MIAMPKITRSVLRITSLGVMSPAIIHSKNLLTESISVSGSGSSREDRLGALGRRHSCLGLSYHSRFVCSTQHRQTRPYVAQSFIGCLLKGVQLQQSHNGNRQRNQSSP